MLNTCFDATQACTKTFRNNELKAHREQILFEREKCLLPAAQEVLAHRKDIVKHEEYRDSLQLEISRMTATLHTLNETIWHMRRGVGQQATEKKEFVRKCPVNDCRGFLSTRWKCDVCENFICVDCNEIKKDDTHVCDPDAVETMKLLKKVRCIRLSQRSGLTARPFLAGHQTMRQMWDDDLQDFRMFADVVRRGLTTVSGLRPSPTVRIAGALIVTPPLTGTRGGSHLGRFTTRTFTTFSANTDVWDEHPVTCHVGVSLTWGLSSNSVGTLR